MYEIQINIGDLFKAISEEENHTFEYDQEFLQKEKLYIKNEFNEWIKITGLIKKEDTVRELVFSDGIELECADKHLISYNKKECIFAKDIKEGDQFELANGKIISNLKNIQKPKEDVYDMQVDSQSHLYQTSNGLIHHNSIFAKHIENNLINKGVCVLSFNLEMSKESSIDRLLCIRERIPLKDMQQPGMTPRLKAVIQRGLTSISKLLNYIYCPDEYMDFYTLDASIHKAKNMFRENKVLPDDEYMVIIIDLLDMVKGFDDPKEIKTSMDELHRLARKHKIHIIGLVQANENKFRNGKIFKNPEELDYYKIGLEDIYNGSSYGARARVVISLNRPLFMKRRFFPELEERWELEDDLILVNVVKQNDGYLSQTKFVFGENFMITPFEEG
jgi:hypothetical protein